MIVPYFNCLLWNFQDQQICQKQKLKIMSYFSTYFQQHFRVDEGLCVCVASLKQTSQTHQKESVLKQIEQILVKQTQYLSKINSSYTNNKQSVGMIKALSELEVKPSQSSKVPAKIENIGLLQAYFGQEQEQMKKFLKNLLIEEISYEKKKIQYRKSEEIKSIISLMIKNLQGQVTIIREEEFRNSKKENIIWVVLCCQEKMNFLVLEEHLRILQQKYQINREINKELTQQSTLRTIANFKIQQIAENYIEVLSVQSNEECADFTKYLNLVFMLKAVYEEGIKLVKEQNQIKESFLVFVRQMTQKSSNCLEIYCKGLWAQKEYQMEHQRYIKRKMSAEMVKQYFKGMICSNSYQKHHEKYRNKQCSIIQKRIRCFLLNKRVLKECLASYIEQKQQQKNTLQQYYTKLIQFFNKNQLIKLKDQNKYKYGFSCCSQIVSINNYSNHVDFDPNNLLSLFQKINKRQESIAKIMCSRSQVQMVTIEGRCYSLGQSVNRDENEGFRTLGKQNRKYDNQNSIQSKYESKETKKNKFDSERVIKSLYSSNQTNITLKLGDSIIKSENEDHQFKIDQLRYLYGRGNNSEGQLGLGNKKYVHEFSKILPSEKVKLISSLENHTVLLCQSNKYYHFGKAKGILPQTSIPKQFNIEHSFIAKEITSSIEDTYFLTDNNKIYSLNSNKFIRVPKQISLGFDHFSLIRTGTYNLEIVYLIAFWINTADKAQQVGICKYLTKKHISKTEIKNDSILVENMGNICSNRLTQLSAILEESDI